MMPNYKDVSDSVCPEWWYPESKQHSLPNVDIYLVVPRMAHTPCINYLDLLYADAQATR